MDGKTTFLNESLEETIYMVQPEGFIAKGHESKVCELQQSMDLSRYQGLETLSLTRQLSHLDLSNVLTNLVCTRDAKDTWWYS